MKDDKPSFTALMVPLSLRALRRGPDGNTLIDDHSAAWYDHVLAAAARKSAAFRFVAFLPNIVQRFLLELLSPCMAMHYAIRKRYIEEAVRQGISDGAKQVISLGAGFDFLLFRLATEFSALNFVEVDHPATQPVKKEHLRTFGEHPLSNLALLPGDLKSGQVFSLFRDTVDPTKPTIIVIEGVLMYLDRDEVKNLLKSIRAFFGQTPVELVFGALRQGAHENASLSGAVLSSQKERYFWRIDPKDMPGFLADAGFKQTEYLSPETLHERMSSCTNGAALKRHIHECYYRAN